MPLGLRRNAIQLRAHCGLLRDPTLQDHLTAPDLTARLAAALLPNDMASVAVGVANATAAFTSPLASYVPSNVALPPQLEYVLGNVIETVSNAGFWTILGTVVLMLAIYDQCESQHRGCSVELYTL